MVARPIIYRDTVVIYATRNKETLRISTGIKAKKLLSTGLVPKGDNSEEDNKQIRKVQKEVQELIDKHPELTPKQISQMHKTGVYPLEGVESKEPSFMDVIDRFIEASKTGERKNPKGNDLSSGSIANYEMFKSKLNRFVEDTGYNVYSWNNINDDFYFKYCDWCWYTLNNHDGTVGRDIVFYKTVLNWMCKNELTSRKINLNKWKAFKEESLENNYLVLYEDEMELLYEMPIRLTEDFELAKKVGRLKANAEEKLEETRDCVLMQFFTCLRFGDLMNLTEENLLATPHQWYLLKGLGKSKNVIKIPIYGIGVEIIKKYRGKYKTLLPKMSEMTYNSNIKRLGSYLKDYISQQEKKGLMEGKVYNNWDTFTTIKTRDGKHKTITKPTPEVLASHAFRKSGISYLLSKGMSDKEVCRISGHRYGSKSFYIYIKIAEEVYHNKAIEAWDSTFGKKKRTPK